MLTGIVAGLAAGALWGLVFVAPRMTPGLSSVDLAAGRFVSYGAVAALVMLLTWRSHKLPTVRQAMAALGMSLLGFTGYYLLLVLAIQHAGTEVPTLIIGTIPIWAMLLGKPHGLKWSSLIPGLLLTRDDWLRSAHDVHHQHQTCGGQQKPRNQGRPCVQRHV